MKIGLYKRLAIDGIRKNKWLYAPYIITGSVMVMMYYILGFLSETKTVQNMTGGQILTSILPLGSCIIAVFSVILLFYTNSFLVKQRYREFGLYNVLGMSKWNISKIMVFETFLVAIMSIIVGIISGIIFSKAAELVMLNLVNIEVNFGFSVGMKSLKNTLVVYGCIYFLLVLNSLIKVRRFNTLELINSNKVGESILKRNWLYGCVGVILLCIAYYLALSIKQPFAALTSFFKAVLLVIIGTYLVFISGSVVFCKLLQKNKKYYYKKNHFVSVSSMVYRMKRNGAGLASICILLTMVLVMLTSTMSLYLGIEYAVNKRCLNDINVTVYFENALGIEDENITALREKISEYNNGEKSLQDVRACEITGLITTKGMLVNVSENANMSNYNNIGYLTVVPITDYNNMMNDNISLSDDECLVYSERLDYVWDTFTLENGSTYVVKKQLTEYKTDDEAVASILPTVFVVVNDVERFVEPVKDIRDENGVLVTLYRWNYGFDIDKNTSEDKVVASIEDMFKDSSNKNTDVVYYSYHVQGKNNMREAFYDLYGSLLFIGIMLSFVFVIAAVVIIYYKQNLEGYEDSARFLIMQKVGMTKKDIKKSINSQVLTIFFLPLIMAGVHIAFAFPFVSKILVTFAMDNVRLMLIVNVVCFVVFGVFYSIVYKITSNAYYGIVSGKKHIN